MINCWNWASSGPSAAAVAGGHTSTCCGVGLVAAAGLADRSFASAGARGGLLAWRGEAVHRWLAAGWAGGQRAGEEADATESGDGTTLGTPLLPTLL